MAAQRAPENPYLAARQEWSERYGSYVRAASAWRTVGILSLGMAVISFGYSLYLSTQVKAEFHEATVEPTAHIAGLEANLQRLILRDAVDQPASDILRPGITFALAELLAIGIDDAD